jgi:hypothetical protein
LIPRIYLGLWLFIQRKKKIIIRKLMIKYIRDNITCKNLMKIHHHILVKRDQQPLREDLVWKTMFKVLTKLYLNPRRINDLGNRSIHNKIIKHPNIYFNNKIKLWKSLTNKARFKEIISPPSANLRVNSTHFLFSHHRMANQIYFKNRMFRIKITFSLTRFRPI